MSKKPPGPDRGLLIGWRKERRLPVLIKLFMFTLGLWICASSAAYGKIQRFTDSQGMVHITNNVPDKTPDEEKPGIANRAGVPSGSSRGLIATPPAPGVMEPIPQPEPEPEAPTPEETGIPQ